ncbi:Apoptosis regulator Bcl-2 [Dissostichus eleginoides]|uniref:Apoptosis regulator Bcl-2 n=1 Tax=Dissostichus eleginoides TaxID=100907 RepID=A0AAD9B7Z7_DISEL|nr:Apoptosis regulator Bcl-2 [Dissostichus eleginoides]
MRSAPSQRAPSQTVASLIYMVHGEHYLNLKPGPVYSNHEAFVELYDRQRESLFSSSWPSIKTVFGLAAIGAASLTIGAYLTQK